MSLIEKGEEDDLIVAQSDAVLWARDYRRVRRIRGRQIDEVLQEGLEVLLKIRVDFHERYGFKMVIEDIDPAYTVGKVEQRKQQVIEQMKAEGLLGKNAQLPLPKVLQRIVVISSQTAAGYKDFEEQLESNPFGYQFRVNLFPAAMQGERTVPEIVLRLRQIAERADTFDAVVIIRGGGARLDLIAFDDPEICRAVANCPIPVLTGIGHEIDETVMDLVAYDALKTPTAVADFIIHHNTQYESGLLELGQQLRQYVRLQLSDHQLFLAQSEQSLKMSSQHFLQQAGSRLDQLNRQVPTLTRSNLKNAQTQLDHLAQLSDLIGPEATLRRGYSIVYSNGKIVCSKKELQKGDAIQIQLGDGTIEGEVKSS